MHRHCRQVIAVAALLGCGPSHAPLSGPRCVTVASTHKVSISAHDPVDLLIVLDVSPAMDKAQAAVARELPELIRRLTTREQTPDQVEQVPLRDLHIGIITSDLGVSDSSLALAGCSDSGDAARLQQSAGGLACQPSYPAFLSYFAPRPTLHPLVAQPDNPAVDVLARDVGCLAQRGSTGCSISQPLEAALRALSPGGDQSGFLRNDPTQGISLVQILLISAGDDCSVSDPQLFSEVQRSGPNAAATVCAEHAELLHGLDRFVKGLRALRRGNENMVQVSAITGIPTAQPNTDKPSIDRYDDMQRETYYASLLADPRMQPRARPDGTLAPVCESELASATPAPRLVEFARRYGAEANVQSICEPDWAAAVLEMLTRDFALQRVGECSSRHWPRSSEGLAACRVLWELPPAGFAPMGTPAHCAERPFLTPATAMSHGENGGELCEVRQLAVRMSGDMRSVEPGEGWFYDDFSVLPQCGCRGSVCNQTVFVPYAPPSGVTMKIECQETQCLEPGCDPSECRVPG